ncbi:phospholipase-like protein [Artemisia annua]|uniref:Phospholipase-like protein n=1 Tax=Artemisia annua TaxID=35608 RepID=A0A2U1MJD2_ARTAN|nr:phospholipase-like protein [Artemisia annua]
MKKVLWYLLHNSHEIDTYMDEYKSIMNIYRAFPGNDMQERFPCWFEKKIHDLKVKNDPTYTSELFALACGPSYNALSVNSCVVNGLKFILHNCDLRRSTQNSGISTPNPRGAMYCSQLKEILEFSHIPFKVVLFKVKWRNFRDTNKDVLFRRTCFGWLFDLAEMQETCILLHYISLCQEELAQGDTDVVPLTYHVRSHELKFGREEFCLVTGLRFGIEFKDFLKGLPTPFRRRVFSSEYDGCNINVGMVYYKLYSEDFDKLSDNDDVRLSLVGLLVLVLLGREFNYKVNNWIWSLVDNLDAWNVYPWGNVVWRTLYTQLAGACDKRLEAFYGKPWPPPDDKGKVKKP